MLYNTLDLPEYKYFIHWLIIFILIVMLWRGTWGLIDLWLFPNNLLLSYAICIIIPILTIIMFYILKL